MYIGRELFAVSLRDAEGDEAFHQLYTIYSIQEDFTCEMEVVGSDEIINCAE